MAGRRNNGYRRPSIAARSHALGPTPLHRRSFAPVRAIERASQPELVFDEIATASLSSHTTTD